MLELDDYDYALPDGLIAQAPSRRRDKSRLLSLDRASGEISHHLFDDLLAFLRPGDQLVINNTSVIPGRLFGNKETGGKVEVLVLDYAGACQECRNGSPFVCQCLVKASKPLHGGGTILFAAPAGAKNVPYRAKATVLEGENGIYLLAFASRTEFDTLMSQIGQVPLPPYIRRSGGESAADRENYQTVYAMHKGAIAAPTAGLHFTRDFLQKLDFKGINTVAITLHVGYGTFLPVRKKDIRRHRMHAERYVITAEAAGHINRAREEGRRIVAVGTTSVRTLEYAATPDGRVQAGSGICDLFIYPGYQFKAVDAMITNFHLPRSTLLMLVSAFAGRERILRAYGEAIRKEYRFYSYGDAMWIG